MINSHILLEIGFIAFFCMFGFFLLFLITINGKTGLLWIISKRCSVGKLCSLCQHIHTDKCDALLNNHKEQHLIEYSQRKCDCNSHPNFQDTIHKCHCQKVCTTKVYTTYTQTKGDKREIHLDEYIPSTKDIPYSKYSTRMKKVIDGKKKYTDGAIEILPPFEKITKDNNIKKSVPLTTEWSCGCISCKCLKATYYCKCVKCQCFNCKLLTHRKKFEVGIFCLVIIGTLPLVGILLCGYFAFL